MVTVKRKISNETERYGGFADLEIKHDNELEIGDSFTQSEQRRAESSFEYSMPSMRTVQESKVEVNQDPPAITPEPTYSQYMLNIHSSRVSQESAKQLADQKQKLDSRTKLLLGVYLSVIVLLSALVIGTGIYLTAGGARVSQLESELSARNVVLNEQITDIAVLSNEDALAGKAMTSGMVAIESTQAIDLLPMENATTYEGTTNWFDSFCDWLSGVMGG